MGAKIPPHSETHHHVMVKLYTHLFSEKPNSVVKLTTVTYLFQATRATSFGRLGTVFANISYDLYFNKLPHQQSGVNLR